MEKKGQFYLIAAIIIVLILFSLTKVSNYLTIREKPKVVGETQTELSRESYRIVEYGIVNNKDLYGQNGLITSFVRDEFKDYYSGKAGEGENEVIFVFGDKNKMNYARFGKVIDGTVSIGNIHDQISDFTIQPTEITDKCTNDVCTVKIDVTEYNFDIKEGEMFYFIILAERNGERFFETDDERKGKIERGESGQLHSNRPIFKFRKVEK